MRTSLALALAALVVVLALALFVYRRRFEGFSWADYGENTSRENYASNASNAEHFVDCFSPDAPGMCSRPVARGAVIEKDALDVLAGY